MKKLITSGIISLAMAGALMAQEGDIVFVIDESGSMGPRIQTVISNVGNLIGELENQGVDYQLGLVGFGSGSPAKGNPRVVTKLTNDSNAFAAGLQALLPVGGALEPGFSAVGLGMSAAMEPENFRPDAGTCVILISDEQVEPSDQTNKASALTALSSRDAIFYGIVNLTGGGGLPPSGNTANDYGPNPGSLAAVTGGTVWSIANLGGPLGEIIIREVMDKCISEAIIPEIEVAFDVHPTSCPNPINLKSKGLTPMAILGTADFDVTEIDVSTLQVNGVSPEKYAYEDVATPYDQGFSDPVSRDECTTRAGDGFTDLTLKFNTQEMGLEPGVQPLVITGQMSDGTLITGQDVVWVK